MPALFVLVVLDIIDTTNHKNSKERFTKLSKMKQETVKYICDHSRQRASYVSHPHKPIITVFVVCVHNGFTIYTLGYTRLYQLGS